MRLLGRPVADAPAAAALGALQTLACVHTAWWPLPFVCIALFVAQLRRATPGRAALLGWAFSTGWLCAAVWWLYISMHRYGGLPSWMAALAVFALAAALSLYLATAAWGWARWRRGTWGADAVFFAALWFAAEWARGVIFTGFPWAASGYTQVDGPLAALAPWVGVYGIGAVLAGLAAAIGGAVALPRTWRGRAAAGLVAVLALLQAAGPAQFTQPTGRLPVSLVQTAVPQDEKFLLERLPATLESLATTLKRATGTLVLAPETAVPLLPSQLEALEPGWWPALRAHFSTPDRHLLVGLPLGDDDAGYTNSVAGASAATAALPGGFYRYDKHHLVPFGEFIPTGFRWFTRMMNIPLGDFARGPLDAPSFVVGVQRIAPNVCYEDLFGEELAVRFTDPAKAPTVLANVSNIGWFGNTIALPQHLNITRLRTLELQRPMLRATNTGVTAVVDHRGVVLAALPPFQRGVLAAEVEGRSGTTPFAWWAGRFGLWPMLALAAAVAWAATRRRRAAVVA